MFCLVPSELVDPYELAVTAWLVTFELVVRIVRFSMFRQVGRLAETLSADLTFQRLLTCMRTYVHSWYN